MFVCAEVALVRAPQTKRTSVKMKQSDALF